MDLSSFFYPRSAVIIGSSSPGKLGAILTGQILDGGYSGQLYAVNPKGEGARGIPAYASVGAIPTRPDLAVIVSPAQTVPAVLEDCGKAGVTSAVIITSGFGETGNQAGEAEIARTAKQYGIRYIGPNCAGIANAGISFFPTLELRVPAGVVGVVTQSGALGGALLGLAQQKQLGISKFISYGNGTDLSQVDFLRYMAADPETKVVAVYIESVSRGREFIDALSECARQKPVLVIKAGRTTAGTRATASHTGSMAGSDAVYDAAIRASGAVRVRSVEELVDLCEGFAHLPPVKGKRIAIVTNSGGPGVLAADLAEEIGLQVTEPGAVIQAQMREFLPGHCSLKNPIDLTVEGTETTYRKTIQAVLPEVDAVVAINVGTSYLDNLALARGIGEAARGSGKPVLASFVPEQLMAESQAYLKQAGIPAYPSGERAVKVLAAMATYEARRAKASPPAKTDSHPSLVHLPGEGQVLEPDAMAWLRENGIPIPEFAFASTAEEAADRSEQIGYPTVMKVVSKDILHKSDVGGVIVGIRDHQAACQAFEQIRQAAAGHDFRGVILYPMIRGAQEVLLGITRDAQFGPVVAFGLGGIYTEILRDVVLRVAPVSPDEAWEMIHEIRAIRLLQGARGKPPCDLAHLAQVLSDFSTLPFRCPEIQEMDLNPVFVFEKGLAAGDVRIIRRTLE